MRHRILRHRDPPSTIVQRLQAYGNALAVVIGRSIRQAEFQNSFEDELIGAHNLNICSGGGPRSHVSRKRKRVLRDRNTDSQKRSIGAEPDLPISRLSHRNLHVKPTDEEKNRQTMESSVLGNSFAFETSRRLIWEQRRCSGIERSN